MINARDMIWRREFASVISLVALIRRIYFQLSPRKPEHNVSRSRVAVIKKMAPNKKRVENVGDAIKFPRSKEKLLLGPSF